MLILAGCADGDDSPEGDSSESPDSSPDNNTDAVLEYSINADEEPEEIPDDIRKSRDEGGRRRAGNKWTVVTFEVVEGTLDMEDVWFRSRIETGDRFYELDHATADLSDGIQSRGEIKKGGFGIALYQIPQDADTYEWNLDEMQQDIDTKLE